MIKNDKLLVLTSYKIEDYINDFDMENVLGLGSWCKSKTYPIKIIENYLDRPNFDRDKFYEEIYDKKKEIVSLLSISLNKIHGVNYSRRYWDIILGPWLMRFVSMAYDKWMTVSQALKEGYDYKYVGLDDENFNLKEFRNSETFIQNTQNGIFNHIIYQDLMKFFEIPCFLKIKKYKKISGNDGEQHSFVKSIIKKLKYILISSLVKIISRKSKYYIYHSYLDKFSKILLGLRFGFSRYPDFDVSDINYFEDNIIRERLKNELLAKKNETKFDVFLLEAILKYIPYIYIENYKDVSRLIESSGLPKKPKIIYTASLHLTNDLFNFWSALNVESGAKLVLGQHGGMFGCAKIIPFERHEFDICDKYITWGWGRKLKKTIQTGMTISKIYKPFGRYLNFTSIKSSLLIVAPKYPRYFMLGISKDTSDLDWSNYFDELQILINSLNRNKIKKVVYRSKSDYGNNVDHYQKFINNSVNVEFQSITDIDISTMVRRSNLVLVTYNATIILQLLSSNIPVVAIWNRDKWSLRDDAVKFFDLLHSVGILHYDAKSASKKINYIWDDVNSWWLSKEVQTAVFEFCSEFAGRTNSFEKAKIIKRSFYKLTKG